MSNQLYIISSSSIAPPIAGKVPKFSIFSEETSQKGKVSFEQWVFEVKRALQSHLETLLCKNIVHSLLGAMADLVQNLDLHAPMSPMIEKLELIYGTMTSFNILMQKFQKLQ